MDAIISFLYKTQRFQIFVLSLLCLYLYAFDISIGFEVTSIVATIAFASLTWSCILPNKDTREVSFQGFLAWILWVSLYISAWFFFNFEFLNAVGCLFISVSAFCLYALIRGMRELSLSKLY